LPSTLLARLSPLASSRADDDDDDDEDEVGVGESSLHFSRHCPYLQKRKRRKTKKDQQDLKTIVSSSSSSFSQVQQKRIQAWGKKKYLDLWEEREETCSLTALESGVS
jgi:hypothetical protein